MSRTNSIVNQPLPRAKTRRPSDGELRSLWREYRRTREPELGRRLAEANVGLAVTIAVQLDSSRGRLLPDLIQEAYVGLLEAVPRYDPERGAGFATYAGFWIRAQIFKFLRDNARLVRLGRSRADRAAYHRGDVPPADVSLDAGSRVGEGPHRLVDRMADLRPRQDVLLEATEVAVRTRALASRFDSREQVVLDQRLLSHEPTPLRSLAALLSLSGERVRQIEEQLLAKLRRQLLGPVPALAASEAA